MKELSVIALNEHGGVGHYVRDLGKTSRLTMKPIEEIDSMSRSIWLKRTKLNK